MIVSPSELYIALGIAESQTAQEKALVNMSLRSAEGAIRRHLQYDPVQRERTEYYPQMDLAPTPGLGVWEVSSSDAYFRRVSQAATDQLQIKHLPIRSIGSLYIDYDGRSGARSGAFASDTQKTEGEDFWPNWTATDADGNKVCTDGVIRSHGLWPSEPGSVKITYTAGYSEDEFRGNSTALDASPIWESVLDEAVRRVKKAASRAKSSAGGLAVGPKASESLGDYSYSLNQAAFNTLIDGSRDLMPETKEKLQQFINLGSMIAM